MLYEWNGYDPTTGAHTTALLKQRSTDGAVYYNILVEDTKADGICAHATAIWQHNNGNLYYDYGMYVCGYGSSKWFSTGARNWTQYLNTNPGVFVDGDAPFELYPIYSFN